MDIKDSIQPPTNLNEIRMNADLPRFQVAMRDMLQAKKNLTTQASAGKDDPAADLVPAFTAHAEGETKVAMIVEEEIRQVEAALEVNPGIANAREVHVELEAMSDKWRTPQRLDDEVDYKIRLGRRWDKKTLDIMRENAKKRVTSRLDWASGLQAELTACKSNPESTAPIPEAVIHPYRYELRVAGDKLSRVRKSLLQEGPILRSKIDEEKRKENWGSLKDNSKWMEDLEDGERECAQAQTGARAVLDGLVDTLRPRIGGAIKDMDEGNSGFEDALGRMKAGLKDEDVSPVLLRYARGLTQRAQGAAVILEADNQYQDYASERGNDLMQYLAYGDAYPNAQVLLVPTTEMHNIDGKESEFEDSDGTVLIVPVDAKTHDAAKVYFANLIELEAQDANPDKPDEAKNLIAIQGKIRELPIPMTDVQRNQLKRNEEELNARAQGINRQPSTT